MPYLSVESFSGTSVVLRKKVKVKFENKTLTIAGITMEEALLYLGCEHPLKEHDTNPSMKVQEEHAEKVIEEIETELEEAAEPPQEEVEDEACAEPEPVVEAKGLADPLAFNPDHANIEKSTELLKRIVEYVGEDEELVVTYCKEHQAKIPLLERAGDGMEKRIRKSMKRKFGK